MKKRGLLGNSIYSVIRSALSVLFPLITLKYASVILGVEGLGQIEFAKSCVSYFLLFSGLGIETLAIRNGSALKDRVNELKGFSNDIFSLHVITSFVALILLGLTVVVVPKFFDSRVLIFVFSLQIPLSLIGVEWVYYIFEDFKYITVRTLICQVIALVIMAVFLKDPTQILIYAGILVFATYGANIYGFFYARKYIRITITIRKSIFKYLPATLVLFFNKLATTVYVNSDVTMLGFLSGNQEIGIYATAVKIYTALKTVVMAVLNVAIPRLTYSINNGLQSEYYRVVCLVVRALILLVPPCIVGLILQANNIILIVSGRDFLPAYFTLLVLAIAVVFSTIAMFFSATVILPCYRESVLLKATTMGACVNVVLNFFFIPQWGCLGAAITTLISEFVVGAIQGFNSKDILKGLGFSFRKDIILCSIGCIIITALCLTVRLFSFEYYVDLIVSVVFSSIAYFALQVAFRNEIMIMILHKLRVILKKGDTRR